MKTTLVQNELQLKRTNHKYILIEFGRPKIHHTNSFFCGVSALYNPPSTLYLFLLLSFLTFNVQFQKLSVHVTCTFDTFRLFLKILMFFLQ